MIYPLPHWKVGSEEVDILPHEEVIYLLLKIRDPMILYYFYAQHHSILANKLNENQCKQF